MPDTPARDGRRMRPRGPSGERLERDAMTRWQRALDNHARRVRKANARLLRERGPTGR